MPVQTEAVVKALDWLAPYLPSVLMVVVVYFLLGERQDVSRAILNSKYVFKSSSDDVPSIE